MIIRRQLRFILLLMLLSLLGCMTPRTADLMSFKKAFSRVEDDMLRTEVNALLGQPSINVRDPGPEWQSVPLIVSVYASTNQAGTRGLATITYLGDRVHSKQFTFIDVEDIQKRE